MYNFFVFSFDVCCREQFESEDCTPNIAKVARQSSQIEHNCSVLCMGCSFQIHRCCQYSGKLGQQQMHQQQRCLPARCFIATNLRSRFAQPEIKALSVHIFRHRLRATVLGLLFGVLLNVRFEGYCETKV